jgi:hypothetical protein
MKRSTLQQHKEAMMLCEEGMITTKIRNAYVLPHNTKKTAPAKTHINTRKIDKYYTNYGMINHNVETCKKKKEDHDGSHKCSTTE